MDIRWRRGGETPGAVGNPERNEVTMSQNSTTAAETVLHPLRQAVTAAEARVAAATARHESAETDQAEELAAAALESAEEELDAAREALDGSDCPREWELSEAGYTYSTITACSAEEALTEARDNVDRSNYSSVDDEGPGGTMWIDVRVHCRETGEETSDTVTCEPDEPECPDHAAHDWQNPYEILGGLKDNPGVWGHGGGVICREVCVHCGCERTTDTWAQRPDNGEQGLTSVAYEPGKYATEVADLRADRTALKGGES